MTGAPVWALFFVFYLLLVLVDEVRETVGEVDREEIGHGDLPRHWSSRPSVDPRVALKVDASEERYGLLDCVRVGSAAAACAARASCATISALSALGAHMARLIAPEAQPLRHGHLWLRAFACQVLLAAAIGASPTA